MLLASYFLLAASAAASDVVRDDDPGDIKVGVTLDADEQSGTASATVRIHARRDVVWSLITHCADALALVPGLVACDVLETAPDASWQIIRHVLNYSWYVPKLTYQVRVNYDKPTRVTMTRIAGDLRTLNVSWVLSTDGDSTVAQYAIELAPGFWVPHWLVRVALRRDLPKMLHALQFRAESVSRK